GCVGWRGGEEREKRNWEQVTRLNEPISPALNRSSHWEEMSANWPLEWINPPSEASMNSPLLFGFTTRACWSGWNPFGAIGFGLQQLGGEFGSVVASQVMSDQCSPASVERTTARPFERKPYSLY